MKTIRPSAVLRGIIGGAALLSISLAYAAPQAHQVAAGDTLIALSKRYNVSVDAIAKANNITPKTTIVIGDTLNIPSTTTANKKPSKTTAVANSYQIQSGDTLMAIAKRYGVTVEALTEANDMTAKTMIRAGDTLSLPKNAKAVKPMPAAPVVTPTPKVTSSTVKAPEPAPKPSAPVATAVATSSEMPDTYTVQAGDTLISIANRYGLSYQDIASASGIEPTATLQIGQTLRLKKAPTVVSMPKETAMAMIDDDIY